MQKSKWPDFLFTIAVRLLCGTVIGGLAGLFLGWKGLLRAFSHDNTRVPLVWLGLCVLAGGIVAIFTVPRWQTPWYKRESEMFDLSVDLLSPDQEGNITGPTIERKSITVTTVSDDGEKHEYASMDEMPPEIRSEIESLEKEAPLGTGSELVVKESSLAGNTITSKVIQQKKVVTYKIIDEAGHERTYHSLDEMPAELRAAVKSADEKSGKTPLGGQL